MGFFWPKDQKNLPKKCRLCLLEKYFILYNPKDATLNSRDKLFNPCRHKWKHTLKKAWGQISSCQKIFTNCLNMTTFCLGAENIVIWYDMICRYRKHSYMIWYDMYLMIAYSMKQICNTGCLKISDLCSRVC